MILHDNFDINNKDHLTISGLDSVDIVAEYGTPLYILDENKIRENCKMYKNSVEKYFGSKGKVLFASKSLSFKEIYKIMKSESMDIDIVSPGELVTAEAAGFPLEKAYFHGNNKTDSDIRLGIEKNIGYFVVDNIEEIDGLDMICKEYGKKQKVLLRLAPGIDPHTHAKIATAKIDSKFGIAVGTGQAIEAVGYILKKENIDFRGIHCHIGSQILEQEPFIDTADCMINFYIEVRNKYNLVMETVNLGGGYGIRYKEEQPFLDIESILCKMAELIKDKCAKNNIVIPEILFEPGRSIVANAGATLYTVGTNKKITGYRNYISIDGSMSDNPRYALYESPYTAVAANKMNAPCINEYSIAGRCCESGDLLQEYIKLPELVRGDILAVLCTGAYNHSMSMNYNRLPRPATVMVYKNNCRLVIKRETFDDLMKNEL